MKKIGLFSLLGLGVLSLLGLGLSGSNVATNVESATIDTSLVLRLDDTDTETAPDTTGETTPSTDTDTDAEDEKATVVVGSCTHGQVVVDKTEGKVGETVTISAVHDVFYVVDSVTVNGTALVEDKETSGKYTFVLAKGENKVEVKFIIDKELLGEMSTIVDQAMNKDWTNLFSVDNVVTIVSFLLNGGVLVAIARYFIKDKRLEAKVEAKIEEVIKQIIPDSTKTTVLTTIKEFITPYFTNIEAEFENVENALTVFSRCLALAQENTPEARIAITQELSSLKLSDQAAISEVEQRLQAFMDEQNKKMADLVVKLNDIHDKNTEIVEGAETTIEEKAESTTETGENTENTSDTSSVPYE